MYFHQNSEWPTFRWDSEVILSYVSSVRDLQGRLMGRMEGMGFDLQSEAVLDTITLDVVKSSEIEAEFLDSNKVRSSVAKQLGIQINGLPEPGRDIDGVVEMMMDATQNYQDELTEDRLFAWHSSLFPAGRSGLQKITVGAWRTGQYGPMRVVSGAIGKEKIHYEAPSASTLQSEMSQFIDWYNSDRSLEPIIKSAIAHLWFVSIHPFADGNGRIARALGDSLLARADRSEQRFYSMSAQIMNTRKGYYHILESTQKGSMDITSWLVWYFERLKDAIQATGETLAKVNMKSKFWALHKATSFNKRQVLMINKLHGEFMGKLHSSKWAKMTKVHRDTARKDIQDLIEKGVLKNAAGGGRSTHYILKEIN